MIQVKNIEPLQLLITGDPSSGKSYVVDTISALAIIHEAGTIFSVSCNGIAAVNIDGGTVCKTLKLFDTADGKKGISADEILLL